MKNDTQTTHRGLVVSEVIKDFDNNLDGYAGYTSIALAVMNQQDQLAREEIHDGRVIGEAYPYSTKWLESVMYTRECPYSMLRI